MVRMKILMGGLVLAAVTACDHAYPTKPIRLIVPFPPGGSNDIVGRIIGNELNGKLSISST